jgi:cytoskeletal protein CcmA (bactofilin family)
LLVLILIPSISYSSQFQFRKAISVAKSEQIDDDLYIFSNYGKLYGQVNGDFSAFCYDVNTIGEIGGNANLFGFRVDLNGKVNKSARLFGNYVNVNGEIIGNLIAFGSDMSIGEKAAIGRDATCFGQKIVIDGNINGNLTVTGDNIIISGVVNGNAKVTAQKLTIIPPAHIKGALTYISKDSAAIESGAVIEGGTTWKLPEKKAEKEGTSFLSIFTKFLFFIMAFLCGLVLIFFFRRHTEQAVLQIEKKIWVILAEGCLTCLICSIGALILMILIVTAPLGIFLAGFGVILFYVGKIYVSIFLGRKILSLFNKNRRMSLVAEFVSGLIILTVLFQIPALGWIIYILTFILGMGAAVDGYLTLCRQQTIAATASEAAVPPGMQH